MSTKDRLFAGRHFSVLLGALILLAATFSSKRAWAQPIPATIAYVVNNRSNNVSVIDMSTHTVTTTIPVGSGPQHVAFSPDGSRAYVTNHLEGSVSVINTFTSTEIDVDGNPGNGITRITVGAPVGQPGEAGPVGVDVSPDGSKVYVGNERSGDISVIDTATNTVIATVSLGTGLGFSPRNPAFTPDGSQVWVGVGAGTAQIKRFAFPSNALLLPTISGVIGNAERIEFLPDGSFAFAQNICGQCGNLQKIDTSSNSVVSTLSYFTNGSPAMAITPDGSFVYAGTSFGSTPGGQVREVDSSTMVHTRTLSVSALPLSIAISPDGGFLYITRWELADVLVVRRSDLTQVTTIAVGDGPFDIAITTLQNQPPTVDIGGPYGGDEGSPISLDGSASSDPDLDPLAYSWSVDSALCSFDNASSATPNLTCTDNGNFNVTLTVDDGNGGADSATAAVTVRNVAPTVSIDSVSPTLIAVGAGVTANGSFTDSGTNDTHTSEWDWGDGTSAGSVSGLNVGPDSHTYTTPGVYTVNLTVTDDDGGVGMVVFEFVVVYDPDGGFVTGGGWIDSPAGAYKPDTSLVGKANFGFVSKYKKGATMPTGNTEFQFHAADLNFHSSSYEWLVVTGGDYARFKGIGTINGMGDYKFMLWAGDSDPDTFRIRIWEEDESTAVETDIYDNGFDQAIGGGSIVIHTSKK